jgi:hypothetical protein
MRAEGWGLIAALAPDASAKARARAGLNARTGPARADHPPRTVSYPARKLVIAFSQRLRSLHAPGADHVLPPHFVCRQVAVLLDTPCEDLVIVGADPGCELPEPVAGPVGLDQRTEAPSCRLPCERAVQQLGVFECEGRRARRGLDPLGLLPAPLEVQQTALPDVDIGWKVALHQCRMSTKSKASAALIPSCGDTFRVDASNRSRVTYVERIAAAARQAEASDGTDKARSGNFGTPAGTEKPP